jgi:endonuclease III related protein
MREPIPQRLAGLYARLRGHFGYAHPWWPGSPLDIALTAILVQQCGWDAAWNGVSRLKAGGLLSLPRLADAPAEAVQECIRSVAFPQQKAPRLVKLARALLDRGHNKIESYLDPRRDTAALRAELLALDGIGEETADCVLLFAGRHPTFVIDAYTRRAFERLALFPELPEGFWKQPYRRVQAFFHEHILSDLSLYERFTFAAGVPRAVGLFRDWHALLVELGKHHCLKTDPRCRARGRFGWPSNEPCARHCEEKTCEACPLAGVCSHAKV